MSEEQIAEALGAAADDQIIDNADQIVDGDENQDFAPESLTAAEQRAWNDGWRPEDQFEGNPENWKTAGEYNLYGEMQAQVREAKAETRRIQSQTEAQITSLNKYHEGKRQAELADLKAQQREAVDHADTERFDRLQTQIDEHQSPLPDVDTGKAPEIAAWEASQGEWINNPNDERTIQANAFYAIAAAKPGATYDSALKYVDDNLSKLYPEQKPQTNPRREMPTMTEQSRRPAGRQRSGKELTMNDLTASERSDWEKFGSQMFTDEKQFLKSVADARKA